MRRICLEKNGQSCKDDVETSLRGCCISGFVTMRLTARVAHRKADLMSHGLSMTMTITVHGFLFDKVLGRRLGQTLTN